MWTSKMSQSLSPPSSPTNSQASDMDTECEPTTPTRQVDEDDLFTHSCFFEIRYREPFQRLQRPRPYMEVLCVGPNLQFTSWPVQNPVYQIWSNGKEARLKRSNRLVVSGWSTRDHVFFSLDDKHKTPTAYSRIMDHQHVLDYYFPLFSHWD